MFFALSLKFYFLDKNMFYFINKFQKLSQNVF